MKRHIIKPKGQEEISPQPTYKRMMPATRDEYDTMMLKRATHYTTIRHLGRGNRSREEWTSIDDARQHGKKFSDGRTMIYAVADGQSIWLENI